jgi:hypothetical protein
MYNKKGVCTMGVLPISYADAFVVAAAQEQDATIVTGDPGFIAVQSQVRIEWLPGSPHSPGT